MLITNQRKIKHNETTAGLLSIDGKPLGWIIEDIEREVKIPKITGIPSGAYKLGIRHELTPLTVKHQKSVNYKGWFQYHIEVINVPNFNNIFFHIINFAKDTDGCQGGGKQLGFFNDELCGLDSRAMTKEFYSIVYPRLLKGEDVDYIITNEYK